MKFVLNEALKTADVIHRTPAGECRLAWDIRNYTKTRFSNVEDPFREINRFMEKLPPADADALWDCYRDAHEAFATIHQPAMLKDSLTDTVGKIYAIVTMRRLHDWAFLHMTAVMPDTSMFDGLDPEHPEEGTYDMKAYRALLVMAVGLQLMVPIWGVYVESVKHSVPNILKEVAAFDLMRKADSVLNDPAMEKLIRYVNNFLLTAQPAQSANLSGLVETRLPEWLLASVIVRRLCIGEVDATADRGHLVSNIHTSMNNLIKDLDRKSGGRFKAMSVEEETNKDEGNTTIADLVKARQDLSFGQMMVYESSIANFRQMAKIIEPDIDLAVVEDCVNLSIHRQELTRSVFQEAVCAYVTYGFLSPQVVPRLDPHLFMILSGVCQAILWHRGFVEIAVYLTATGLVYTGGTASATDVKNRPTTKMVDSLIDAYPASHPAHKAPVDGSIDRKNNVAIKAVAKVVADLGQFDNYQVTCPDALWGAFPLNLPSKRIPIVPDISEKLGELLLDIKQRLGE